MHAFDPASLILTNGLVTLALSLVLLVSRIGMGDEGRGIACWVLADVAMAAGRGLAVAGLADLPWALTLPFPVATGTLVMLGLAGHWLALRSLTDHPTPPGKALLQALALALLLGLPALWMPSLMQRVRWFDGLLLLGAVVTLLTLRPLLQFWGARLIASMMVLAIVFQGWRFAAWLLGLEVAPPAGTDPGLRHEIRPGTLVMDVVIALVVTSGFVLLLQERLRARISRLVVTDALTGALNRHGLMPQLHQALAQAQQHQQPVSLVLFDLDHFKRINDEHGHAVGDAVLSGFVACITAQLREGDALGRWGGEEFLLLLPNTAPADALALAERLRRSVAQSPLAADVVGGLRVTVSGGLACAQQHPQALLKLLDLADKRLYLAKRQRNCVVADGGDLPTRAGLDDSPAPARAGHALHA